MPNPANWLAQIRPSVCILQFGNDGTDIGYARACRRSGAYLYPFGRRIDEWTAVSPYAPFRAGAGRRHAEDRREGCSGGRRGEIQRIDTIGFARFFVGPDTDSSKSAVDGSAAGVVPDVVDAGGRATGIGGAIGPEEPELAPAELAPAELAPAELNHCRL